MVKQHDLSPAPGSKGSRKRVGRGSGSGHGNYSGKGMKGQKSRSGGGVKPYFEGGQLPLVKRLPTKRGFTNIFRTEYVVVNVGSLNVFEPGSSVDREMLVRAGVIKKTASPIKLLGTGTIDRALTVRVDKYSASAKEKIVAAGGTLEEAGVAEKR